MKGTIERKEKRGEKGEGKLEITREMRSTVIEYFLTMQKRWAQGASKLPHLPHSPVEAKSQPQDSRFFAK